ncbi:hypothetical protein LZ31DRAFT_346613 [Colletotrichum somersetense]|nr:hypothetical protein LZ31DRAFT_346613 [Colletotrichum somersetense]
MQSCRKPVARILSRSVASVQSAMTIPASAAVSSHSPCELLILLRVGSVWTVIPASTDTSTASTVLAGSTFTVPGARTVLCTTDRAQDLDNEQILALALRYRRGLSRTVPRETTELLRLSVTWTTTRVDDY